ncbi:MAG: hypothetical protein LBO64_03350 [Desulfovibrio sp.]|jgi:hypothetical protein|nr:hypothetical protein [Desulfovibrio sp.]
MDNSQLTKEVMEIKQTLARIEQKVDDQQKIQLKSHGEGLSDLFGRMRALEAKDQYRTGYTAVIMAIGGVICTVIYLVIKHFFLKQV